MADREEDLSLRDKIDEQLRLLEQCVETRDRAIASLTSKRGLKAADPGEDKAFNSALESLKKEHEDIKMKVSHLRQAREAEDDIEDLRRAVSRLKMEDEDSTSRLVFFTIDDAISEEVEGDRDRESSTGKQVSYARRWLVEKLRLERDQPEEDPADVLDRLRQKVSELEGNLYFLLSKLFSFIARNKEQATRFEEFKSLLEWLEKGSSSKIVRGILDLTKAFERQVGKFGSQKGNVEKGGTVHGLLDHLLGNVQLMAGLVDQQGCAEPEISLLDDRVEECEADQKEIESKIKALKIKG